MVIYLHGLEVARPWITAQNQLRQRWWWNRLSLQLKLVCLLDRVEDLGIISTLISMLTIVVIIFNYKV